MKKTIFVGLFVVLLLAAAVSAQRPTREVYCQGVANAAQDSMYNDCMDYLWNEPDGSGICSDIAGYYSYGPSGVFSQCMSGDLLVY